MTRPTGDRRRACPLCAAPSQPPFAPFCSKGCRDRDFLNWMGDRYALPAAPDDRAPIDSADEED